MQATSVIVAVLAAHLLCFGVLAFLMGSRLPQVRGTRELGWCTTMLSASFVMQLVGRRPDWDALGVVNHTLSTLAPVLLWVGLRLMLDEWAPSWRVLAWAAAAYTAAQIAVHPAFGPSARFVLLSACSVAIFGTITVTMWRTAGRHPVASLRVPLRVMAAICVGCAAQHAVKAALVVRDGLSALDASRPSQTVFYAYLSVMAVVLAPLVTWMVFIRITRELENALEHDPLTGVLNRRGMMERLSGHLAGPPPHGVALLLVDVDRFKAVNDTYGHTAGDEVLCRIADALRGHLRAVDFVARTGGEEFIVGCLDPGEEEAAAIAERLRVAVAAETIRLGGADVTCTVSIGVSPEFHHIDGFDAAFHEADQAMYAAKDGGRDRVVAAHPARAA